ncbi:MAG: anaerobic ribonucleoside-triphosphate reductase [Candidatus Odinarchaeota archaeon]
MGADKKSVLLEKHLRILGQKNRIDILKKLNNSLVPLSYSILQKEISDINQGTINLSFHLKTLKESKLIESLVDGYQITILGKKILKNILPIEQILNTQNKTLMIRTSKYSKEPFNINKIQEYLIKEGELEGYQAKQIAQEVEERLSKTNIEYLTAPLMREYINAVLLENGLEKIRHKLTRLGTPPYEVFKLFENNLVNPEQFIKRLGFDVSEQFLLLNLLPNDLADLYLSGELAFINLSYWSLRPLGFYITTESILKFIQKSYKIEQNKIYKISDCFRLILKFFDVISQFEPYFSKDILLGAFNNCFLPFLDIKDENSNLFSLLLNQILKSKCSFTLEFSSELTNDLDCQFFTTLSSIINSRLKYQIPLVLLDYTNLNGAKFDFLYDQIIPELKKYFIFYNKNSNLLNSSIINIKSNNDCDVKENKIILDKILINLHSIALQSNQNDDKFFGIIKERLDQIFKIYKIKAKLIYKKLKSLNDWNIIIRNFFNENESNWLKNSLKSVSFFGLNQAVKTHCGIELDRIDTSQKFALKIISLMKQITDETAQDEEENYILSQPHSGDYLKTSLNNIIAPQGLKSKGYSMNIIRKESNLSIERQISIFKKFEKIINGGVIFSYKLNKDNSSIRSTIDYLIKSKLTAFNFL